ncbi:MAG: hypothetical protein Q8858_07540 [Bacteroidota bacterium]|nr:hypothetical protein [Bacteroidota bacterium]
MKKLKIKNPLLKFFLLVLLVFPICTSLAQTQQLKDGQSVPPTKEHKGNISAGIRVGYGHNLFGSNHSSYILPALFFEYSLSDSWEMLAGVEYFRTKTQSTSYSFYYKDTEYRAQHGQLWKNYSIELGIKNHITKLSSAGIALSLESIFVREINPNAKEYLYAFRVDPVTDNVSYYSLKTEDNLLVPAVSFFATTDLLKNSPVIPFIFFQYKLSFVGEKYGSSPLETLGSFRLAFGTRYSF